jgi:hypothetical protein
MAPKVLYNLQAVLSAKVVFVVKTETDADALEESLQSIRRSVSLGSIASTTCAGGLASWSGAFSRFLNRKTVAVVVSFNSECDWLNANGAAKLIRETKNTFLAARRQRVARRTQPFGPAICS